MSSDPRPAARARGIAILSVVTVLVALLLIAIPFVISQKLGRDRTESTSARNRAAYEADLVCRAVVSYLHRTHPAYELRRRASAGTGAEADDTVDTIEEFTPDPSYRKVIADLMTRVPGQAPPSVTDPRSSIWSWKVTDAAGLVNCNGGSPWLLANLLGAANLAEKVDASATVIPVEGVFPSPQTGLRAFRKEGGFVRIGNEVIQYQAFEDGAFRGCQRGALRESASIGENGGAQEHEKGERVVDYAAWKIATHLIAARPGRLTSFGNLEDLKSIHMWGGGGALEAARLEAISPFVTVWGRRETVETFLDGQLVVNALPSSASDAVGEEIRVRDRSNLGGSTAYFGRGTLVRLTDGLQTDYGVVLYPSDAKGGQFGTALTLASRLPEGRVYEGGRARIEPLGPWPVNVNTASREVLAAVLCGLRMRGVDDPKLIVGPELAWDLATKIVETRAGPMQSAGGDDDRRKSGPFRHVRDVGQWLEDLQGAGTLQTRQAEAILRNVVNPHDNELEYGTSPFCFRTLDVYVVEGRAVVNDAAGRRVAESALRQVVEVGADEATTWTLDSQADLDRGLALGSGGKFVETYPYNVGFVNDVNAWTQPRKRAPQMFQRRIWPSDVRSEDLGDVRLQASRVDMQLRPTFKDHFDDSIYSDGWFTSESGAYSKPVKKNLRGDGANDLFIHPFTVAFWMRPYSEGEWFAFDTGKMNDQNRISVFVRDGQEGKELVLRVCDATMEEIGAEVYVPLQRIGYRAETWYHFQANVRGCDPSMMELLVDGVSVGRRAGLSYLASGLNADQDSVSVESTRGFAQKGAILVGDEVIEYDQLLADGFTQVVRGARGTKKRDWPQGTAVKRVGYSHPLLLDLRKGGAGLEQPTGSSGYWETWDYGQLSYTNDQCTASNGTANLVFKGAAEDSATFTATMIDPVPPSTGTGSGGSSGTTSTKTVEQRADAFQSKGFALVSCLVLDLGTSTGTGAAGGGALLASAPWQDAAGGGIGGGTRPVPGQSATWTLSGASAVGGWEVVWYERQGTSFTITRYQGTPNHKDTGTKYFLATTVDRGNGDEMWPCRIIPISVLGVPAGDQGMSYLDPTGSPEDKQKLAKFSQDGDPDDSGPDRYDRPRVVLGDGDGRNEVICYDSIDRQRAAPNILFCRDNDGELATLNTRLQSPPVDPDDIATQTGTGTGTGTAPGGALLTSFVPGPSRRLLLRPQDAPPAPGGGISPGTREPPPDDSGGGGTQPSPGTGSGNNQPPPGVRPPTDPPPPDTTTNPGTGGSGTASFPPQPPDIQTIVSAFPFRGVNDSDDPSDPGAGRRHRSLPPSDPEAKLLPCFRILRKHEDTGLPVGGPHAGFNDVVTLSTGQTAPRREQMRVRWSHGVQDGGRTTSWVALTDFIQGDTYAADNEEYKLDYRGATRMLCFPSGEMPDEEGENLVFARNEVGGGDVVTAFLDEVNLWRHSAAVPVGIVVRGAANANVTAEEKEITIRALPPATTLEGVEGHDKDVGLVSIDGELIVYRSTRSDQPDSITLEDCRRGALGTKARAHGAGTLARFVPDVYVSALDGTLPKDGWSVPLKHTRRWPREGTARIVGTDTLEIIHYTGVTDEGLVLPQASDADPSIRGRGLLRGRYGTDPMDHESGSIVVWMPVRYWDRTLLRRAVDKAAFGGVHEHPSASYMEFARTIRDAVWRRVTWSENLDGRLGGTAGTKNRDMSDRRAPSKMDVLVLARFDQGVPWDDTHVVDLRGDRPVPPEAKAEPQRFLFLLDDPETANRLDVEASTAEFRVYFPYLPGAYASQEGSDASDDLVFENAWKNTPWLRSFSVEYANRTKVRYQAEIR